MANLVIKVRDKEHLGKALRKFKKQLKDLGVLKDYYSKQQYTKPSVKRREARNKAKRLNGNQT